jgi:lysophospholipase L1-like esterase
MGLDWAWRGVVGLGLVVATACAADEPQPAGGDGPLSVGGTGDTGDDPTGEGESTVGEADTEAATSAPSDTTAMPPDDTGTATSADGGSTDAGEESTGTPPPMGLDDVGSLVILGDSIGDGGGQSPFYYALLRDDLDAHYGGIEYVNQAQSGSETGALVGQVDDLPNNLPGPVVVVITSGGNDMKDQLPAVILGTDGPALMQVANNIDAALADLLAPGRFGAGVEVYVFEGNIYDASDGAGDFGQNDCNFANGVPAIPSDMFFERWNDNIRDAVEARGQTAVDMHGYFYGHGYHASPSWYASDCTHPNALGHDELHNLFYEQITGEPAP